ncbi:MAG TPA: inositol monophosphatase [Acidiferrobacteraceae bacterium]|nr:inositol monophosphatase [Acidiferrobacteraceae bacterium]
MLPDIEILEGILRQIASDEALGGFTQVEREVKWDGSVVTETDRRIQQRIESVLKDHWPDIPLLGEEMNPAQQEQLLVAPKGGLWVLDPLDGTTNFASGLPFFCVSLALIQQQEAVLGVIYDPLRDECFMAEKGAGARLNGAILGPAPQLELSRTIAGVDFKRLPGPLADQLAHAFPYMSQRSMGSSCLDWCWLAAGRFQVYIHGGQKLWDYSAGDLILREAGGYATTLNGEPVFAGQLAPRSVVAAVNGELFAEWKAWIERNKDTPE